jgi:TP901-1 family phage major tail protein
MAAQIGLNMLVKVDSDGAGTYLTIAGGQTLSMKLNREQVDITSQDDVSRYRQLIADAGVKSVDITIRGVFKDAAADATARNYWQNDIMRNWQMILPSFQQVTGPFQVSNIEYSGSHNGEVQYDFSLSSAGDLTWVAL